MRVFAEEEKSIINKILNGEGYARNLINMLADTRELSAVRIEINRSHETANFLFEIQAEEPTDQEMNWGIERHKHLIELIITHVTLLRYIENEELAVFFDPALSTDNIIKFGFGASNMPYYSMEINDKNIVKLLIKYIQKEIKPSPLLFQLVKNDYLTDEEIKFKKQNFVTWIAVVTSMFLGGYGIFNNHQNSVSQNK